MSIVRWIATVVVLAAAVWLLQSRVLFIYELNVQKRTVAERTNAAFAAQETMRQMAGDLARQNAADLEPWARRYPMDPDLQLIRAANLRLIGRDREAAEAYATAVYYQPTPELLMNLGRTQLALGRRDEARATMERAVAFKHDLRADVDQLLSASARVR